MLTRAQIQRIAQHNGIGMQVQERDYVQHVLLWLLYRRGQALVYKGGTALRMVYGGSRYSEDLDFNAQDDEAALRLLWQEIVGRLIDFGIHAQIRREWISDVGYSFEVSYQGPLYDGRDRSKGKVRIDLNRRPEPVETRRALVTSDYADVRPFVVTVLTAEQLAAEKLRALLVRGKPRDLYDVWLLLSQGVRPGQALLQSKLALYDMEWGPEALLASLDGVRAGWERDLRHLLPQFVPYEVAREGLVSWLTAQSADR